MKFPLVGGSFKSAAVDANYQRCINMFPISTGEQGRGSAQDAKGTALVAHPGLALLVDLGGARARGCFTIGSICYAVVDNSVWKLTVNTSTGTCTTLLLGTIGTSIGIVKFARNPTQIMIVDGSTSGYIITIATDVLAIIADTDFKGGTHVVFIDSYFFYNEPNTAYLRCSAANDGTTWDPLDVATVESRPDNLVGLALNKGEIWAFGTDTVEIWYDAANPTGLPFSPRVGSQIDVGCSAAGSIVELDNLIMWLDSRGFVVKSQISAYIRNNSSGYDLKIVSDEAVQTEFATYPTLADAVAMAYTDRGHIMYQITFPAAGKTWVYDHSTGIWTEKSYRIPSTNVTTSHLAEYTAKIGRSQIVCGSQSGKIYLMSADYKDDDGTPMVCTRTTPVLSTDQKQATVDCLEIRMESGNATSTGDGSDPQVSMRYSNDGAHTWSNWMARSMGKIGEYGKPIRWNRLGSGREWIFEFSISEPIDFSLIDGQIDLTNVEGD